MSRFFILFIFLFNSLYAEQEQFGFIGLVGSTETLSFTPNASLDDHTETSFGLRFGRQTQDYRTVITVAGNNDQQSVAVEADFFLMDDMFGMPEIRPYIGGTLGYVHYDETVIDSYRDNIPLDINETKSTKTSDGYYGLNFGFVFYVTDNIDLDVAYSYYFMDRLKPLDTKHGLSFALHYFY